MKSLSIQYIRGVAAALVVLYHAAVYLERIRGENWLHDAVGGRPGLYGVVAFFVLSGLLMADIAPRYPAATFLTHRVLRIYPAYWLCVVLAHFLFIALWIAKRPDAAYIPNIMKMLHRNGWGVDTLRLVLSPMNFPDFPLGVEWTLLYETTFYVLVFTVIAMGLTKWLPHLAIGWLLVITAATVAAPTTQVNYTKPDLASLALYAINGGFIFGIVVQRHISRVPVLTSALAGIVLVWGVDLWPTPFAMLQMCAGIGLIVTSLVAWEHKGGIAQIHALKKLGDWSYAMYLVHIPILLAVCKLAPRSLPSAAVLLLIGAAVLAGAAGVGEADLWMYSRLKKSADRAPHSVRVAIAALMLAAFLGSAGLGLLLLRSP